MSNGYTFELRWTCPSCNAKNLGRHMKCQQCHAPIPADVEYEDVDESTAPVVTDPTLLSMAEGGENWKCSYCGGQVRNAKGQCAVCSAPRAEATATAPSPQPSVPIQPQKRPLSPTILWVLTLSFGFPCCFGLCLATNNSSGHRSTAEARRSPSPAPIVPPPPQYTFVDVEYSASSWKIDEVRQARRLVHHGDWGAAPADALHTTCHQKISGYQDCDSYECGSTTESYDCDPYDCKPRQEKYDCSPHNCRPHTVQVSKGTESCHCHPGNCRNLKNGFKQCEDVCDRCPVYGTETRYDTCYDTCTRTTYQTCYKTCHRTLPKTCWHQCPVEREWCEYDAETWVDQGEMTSLSGTTTMVTHKLKAKSEKERIRVDGRFKIVFAGNGSTWTYQTSAEAEFAKFVPSTRWRLKIDRDNQISEVLPLSTEQKQ